MVNWSAVRGKSVRCACGQWVNSVVVGRLCVVGGKILAWSLGRLCVCGQLLGCVMVSWWARAKSVGRLRAQ